MRVVAGEGERPGTHLRLAGMRQTAGVVRKPMRQQRIGAVQVDDQTPGGGERHCRNMQQAAVTRRIGQQLLDGIQNIVITYRLAVMPVRAAAQVKMPAQPVFGAGPVVRQVGHRLRLPRLVARQPGVDCADDVLFGAAAMQGRVQRGQRTVPGNSQRRLMLEPFTAEKRRNDVVQAGRIAIRQLQRALIIAFFQTGVHQRGAEFVGGRQTVQGGAMPTARLGAPAQPAALRQLA
ncbi:hypothetical protein D3C75_677230 [compost metagenome]